MRKFTTEIMLSIDEFSAENEEQAELIINNYVDLLVKLLASVPDLPVFWESCGWETYEVTEEITLVQQAVCVVCGKLMERGEKVTSYPETYYISHRTC